MLVRVYNCLDSLQFAELAWHSFVPRLGSVSVAAKAFDLVQQSLGADYGQNRRFRNRHISLYPLGIAINVPKSFQGIQ